MKQTKTATEKHLPKDWPRCWQCKSPMIKVDGPRNQKWNECPKGCGPKALADLFRF